MAVSNKEQDAAGLCFGVVSTTFLSSHFRLPRADPDGLMPEAYTHTHRDSSHMYERVSGGLHLSRAGAERERERESEQKKRKMIALPVPVEC